MGTARSHLRDSFCAVVAGLFAVAAWADGELDTSFGTEGAVRVAFPDSSLGYVYDLAQVDGAIEAAGFERDFGDPNCAMKPHHLFVVRLSLAGTIIGSPESYTQNAIQCPVALVVDTATGDIYVGGYNNVVPLGNRATVVRFSATGAVIATYTDPWGGHYDTSYCNGTRLLIDASGQVVAACGTYGEFGARSMQVLRFSTEGDQLVPEHALAPDFQSVGGHFIRTWHALTQDANSGSYYVGGFACRQGDDSPCLTSPLATRHQYIARLDATSLLLDTNYGSGGLAAGFSLPGGDAFAITLDSSGNVLVGGEYGDGILGYVARLTSDGTPDPSFGTNGLAQDLGNTVVDLRTDYSDRVYALQAGSHLVRLKSNGTIDGVASSSYIQTLNGAGSKWQSMQFVDDTHSSVYLVGGADGSSAATTAIIAKVKLDWNASTPEITTTLLESSATTIISGQAVTFTATVSGNSPTGAVTFRDGSMTLGSPVALESGSASYTTSALAIGSHSIAAAYGGDDNNAPSTSAVLTETVDAAPDGGEPGNGSGRNGGGSMTLLDLCVTLLWTLCRASQRSWSSSAGAGRVRSARIPTVRRCAA